MDNNDKIVTRRMASGYSLDEISFKELSVLIWQGKGIVFIVTLMFAIGATIYAHTKPDLYRTESKVALDFSAVSSKSTADISKVLDFDSDYIHFLKIEISNVGKIGSGSLGNVRFSINKASNLITLSEISENPSNAFQDVKLATTYMNQAIKNILLRDIQLKIDSLKPLLDSIKITTSQDFLAKEYANLLYQEATIKNPKNNLAQVVVPPVKATTNIAPRRALIISIGIVLGLILSTVFILVRYSLSRRE